MAAAPLHRPLAGVALITLLLLPVPAIAMQFTAEMSWGPGDFVAAGALLFSAGALAVLAMRRISGKGQRIAALVVIAAVAGLIWLELAAGILG